MAQIHLLRSLLAFLMVSPLAALAQVIPAFSGADGAAANVTGGRGGIVYHVTKLDQNYSDVGPGTLRYGLTDGNFAAGTKRTIVFDVAGTFWLGRFGADRGHDNGWDTQSRLNLGSNVTVAGQTAPGPVYIMGGVVKAGSNNTILRNVAIAPGYGMRSFEKPDDDPPILPTPGDFPDSYVYDAIDITATNIMIDHVSTFYSTDETISANELANNITIQYSNISQGQNYPQADAEGSGVTYVGHALGSLLQAGSNAQISVHHNLYAHQKGRLPRVGSEVGTGAFNDFRNNVFYNWFGTAGSGASGQPSFNNFVGNFYLSGPGGSDVFQDAGPDGEFGTLDDQAYTFFVSPGGTGIFSGSNAAGTRVYHSGNLRDVNNDGDAGDGTTLTNGNFGASNFQASPLWYQGQATYTGVTDTSNAAYDRVLDYMGANWWTRDDLIDTVDERLINEVRTGSGYIIDWADNPFYDAPDEGGEWRELLSYRADTATGAAPFNRPADWDSDQDGMPNEWEGPHGLNPGVADNNGDFDSDGYTNLEEYINEIAAWPAPAPVVFNAATNSRYAQISNWDSNADPLLVGAWQPSKYDEAQVNSGTVVVDAVGQHAGVLKIAANSGNTAQLNVTAGWLLVNDAVVIGGTPTSVATLNLSGGVLDTALLSKGANGEFNFTGGVLHADTVNFDLVNNGGTLAPGHSPGITTVLGNLQLNSGTLDIELAPPGINDFVSVTGDIVLGGELSVRLVDGYVPNSGDVFTILSGLLGSAVSGTFDNLGPNGRILVEDGAGSFQVTIGPSGVELSNFVQVLLAGDYNGNNVVDAADYTAWRNSVGSGAPLINETASLGVVDQADYDTWKANFGATGGSGSAGAAPAHNAVPEPATATAVLILTAMAWLTRRSMRVAFRVGG